MPDALFVTMDGGGNVPPTLGVATAMARLGHRVRVMGHSCLRDEVERAGLLFRPYRTAREWDSTRQQSALRWVPMFNDAHIADEVRRECAADNPDVAVVDCMLLPALRAVQESGVPHAVLSHTFRGYLNRMHRLGAGTAARLYGHRMSRSWNSADLNIVTTARSLDPESRRKQPANVRWVGAVVDAPEPGQRDDPPRILISMSTNGFRGQERTLQRIADALGTMPIRAVMTTGGVVDPGSLHAPANVDVVGYVDHGDLMPRCSLLIGHGGHASTLRALAHDLPTLIIPASQLSDQRLIGVSITRAGAGLTLPKTASVEAIRTAVTTMLTQQRFRSAAARIGAELRATDAASDAADLVAALVR